MALASLSFGITHARAEEGPAPPSPEVESPAETDAPAEAPEPEAPPSEPSAPSDSEDAKDAASADDSEPPVTEGEIALESPAAEEAPQEEAPSEGPMEVTVVGTSVSRTAGSAHIIKEAQLDRFRYDDPGAVIQQVPGAYVRQEDGVGLRPNIGIRGVNPDRSKKLTLMEDGVLFGPAPYSAPAAYYFPLMARMRSVRVIKGPAAVAYGPQTVGGAVDLVTRRIPSTAKGGFDVGLGEYGYAKGHGYFGAGGEQLGFLVEGVHLHNDGFKELPDGANTGFTRNEWMMKSSYVVDPDARIWNEFSLKLTFSDEVSNETYLGLTDADFRKNPYRRYAASALDQMKNHRTAVALSHLVSVPESSIEVRTTVYRQDYARVWRKINSIGNTSLFDILRDADDPSNAAYYAVLTGASDSGTSSDTLFIGPNDRKFVSQGIQSVLSARPTTGPIAHRLEVGVRLHNDEIQRRHSESGYLMESGKLVADGYGERITAANTAATYALATHVVDAMTWDRLTVTPGVRVELIQSRVTDRLESDTKDAFAHAVLPGIGAFYSLTNEIGVLGGVHRGFSPPPPGEKDIEPEYSVNYEAGARFSSGPARAEVIGFFNDYSNLTDICTLSSGCVSDNLDRQFDAGRAHIYGFEAYAGHDLPLGPLTMPMTLAYTFTHARFMTSFRSQDPIYGSVTKGDEIPYIPRHQLSASLGLEGKRGGGVVGVNYVSPMREEAGSGPMKDALHTDEQFSMDVGAHVRVYGPVVLYGNVRNVLDAQDIVSRRPYGARPNAPRWIQIGAKADF